MGVCNDVQCHSNANEREISRVQQEVLHVFGITKTRAVDSFLDDAFHEIISEDKVRHCDTAILKFSSWVPVLSLVEQLAQAVCDDFGLVLSLYQNFQSAMKLASFQLSICWWESNPELW